MNTTDVTRNLKRHWPLYLIVLAVGIWVVGDFRGAHANLTAQKVEYTQVICDHARSEINGSSEQACADAQTTTGTEYLCTSTSPKASCWVEVK